MSKTKEKCPYCKKMKDDVEERLDMYMYEIEEVAEYMYSCEDCADERAMEV